MKEDQNFKLGLLDVDKFTQISNVVKKILGIK